VLQRHAPGLRRQWHDDEIGAVVLERTVLAARWGAEDARVDDARITLASALTALGRYAEADEVLAGALDRVLDGRSPEDAIVLRARDARRTLDRERTLARAGA
jgi:hypothetical protein